MHTFIYILGGVSITLCGARLVKQRWPQCIAVSKATTQTCVSKVCVCAKSVTGSRAECLQYFGYSHPDIKSASMVDSVFVRLWLLAYLGYLAIAMPIAVFIVILWKMISIAIPLLLCAIGPLVLLRGIMAGSGHSATESATPRSYQNSPADRWIDSYHRGSGTVKGHYRTNPDWTEDNNYTGPYGDSRVPRSKRVARSKADASGATVERSSVRPCYCLSRLSRPRRHSPTETSWTVAPLISLTVLRSTVLPPLLTLTFLKTRSN